MCHGHTGSDSDDHDRCTVRGPTTEYRIRETGHGHVPGRTITMSGVHDLSDLDTVALVEQRPRNVDHGPPPPLEIRGGDPSKMEVTVGANGTHHPHRRPARSYERQRPTVT
jgi:hypothetical protein